MLETTIYASKLTKSGSKGFHLVVVQDQIWSTFIRNVASTIYGLRAQGYEIEKIEYPDFKEDG